MQSTLVACYGRERPPFLYDWVVVGLPPLICVHGMSDEVSVFHFGSSDRKNQLKIEFRLRRGSMDTRLHSMSTVDSTEQKNIHLRPHSSQKLDKSMSRVAWWLPDP